MQADDKHDIELFLSYWHSNDKYKVYPGGCPLPRLLRTTVTTELEERAKYRVL